MKINYNVTGEQRKELVKAIGVILQVKPLYMKMPTCAYKIGDITVDKEGTLICEDDANAERIAHNLIADGFTAADNATESAAEEAAPTEEVEAPDSLTISMPKNGFTDEAIANLKLLVESKATLIKKALGAEGLPITVEDDKISFPWFSGFPAPEEISAYAKFIGRLCGMAKTQNRVTAKDKTVDNDKYAFRCFLLRLGFIGAEYKADRKILLKNLTGSSAFKGGAPDADE
ncbi:virulence protein [Caproicibacterium sp. BJN0003]|uniref:virulence protein n=1 Tax=Caproicibacterium sp. BJN0003 TaxID=2994078 RepID=UPI00225A3847|nr:virulence protein [Caproicibacterium sp. BJN0003]UZT81588.1 virulence protein [Caproicibacterium sp. BJN0003]